MPAAAGRPPDAPLVAWLRTRARLWPGALDGVRGPARGAYPHAWAPVQLLGRCLACLPDGLWAALLRWESGHALLYEGESRYEPGELDLRGRPQRGVALLSLVDLAGKAPDRVLHVMGHLVDHHLGCGGAEDGTWLSGGGGMAPAWREAGQRLPALFDLGYGIDEVARSGVRDYFAQSLAAYCWDRQALSVADPPIVRWLRTTLWNSAFWQQDQDSSLTDACPPV